MSYTQKWGISRNAFQSPLHDNGEEETPSTNIIKENNEKATTEKRGFLDRFQDVLTLGGFAPGPIGAGIDLLNTAVSGGRSISSLIQGDTEGAKKHGMNALLYGLSSVPGAGDAFAAANLAKKGTKFVKEGSLAYKGMKGITIGEGLVSAESIARKDLGVDTSLKDPNLISTQTSLRPAVFKPGTGRGMNRA